MCAWVLAVACLFGVMCTKGFRDTPTHIRKRQKVSKQIKGDSIEMATVFTLSRFPWYSFGTDNSYNAMQEIVKVRAKRFIMCLCTMFYVTWEWRVVLVSTPIILVTKVRIRGPRKRSFTGYMVCAKCSFGCAHFYSRNLKWYQANYCMHSCSTYMLITVVSSDCNELDEISVCIPLHWFSIFGSAFMILYSL